MLDFSKFDNNIDLGAIEEARTNPPKGESLETPAGNYVTRIEKMELGTTKDDRPMFKVMMRVVEAGENATAEVHEYLKHFKNKKPCLFMNRVIFGTKNDANMIASVLGWLDKLETETRAEFKNYNQFYDCVLDIFEEVADSIELDVNYDPDSFNSIEINEVFEVI